MPVKPTRTPEAEVAAAAFAPQSEAVVLAYLGGADGVPALGGIPARDLTSADICRLVYAQAVTAYDGTPESPPMPDPAQPDQAKCAELVELLLSRKVDGRAVYAAAEAAPPPTEAPAPAPDAPAEPEA